MTVDTYTASSYNSDSPFYAIYNQCVLIILYHLYVSLFSFNNTDRRMVIFKSLFKRLIISYALMGLY